MLLGKLVAFGGGGAKQDRGEIAGEGVRGEWTEHIPREENADTEWEDTEMGIDNIGVAAHVTSSTPHTPQPPRPRTLRQNCCRERTSARPAGEEAESRRSRKAEKGRAQR